MNLATNFQTLQQDAAFINQVPVKYLGSFCKLAVSSMIEGVNKEKISKAASSLEQDEEIVTNAIRALAQILKLLASASPQKASKKTYMETFTPLKLTEEAYDAIYEFYQSVHGDLRSILTQFKIETSRYHKFDWRLDIQIGSRALHRRVDPVYLCELQTSKRTQNEANGKQSNNDSDEKHTENEDNSKQSKKRENIEFEKTLFECNYATLGHMIEQFEQALRETQQSWYKKVSRQTK
eukprot:CAMPEP_0197031608 /NCGR_PEP_ID=MMETSP1384-20130603/10570_1 /TAXON_ID=29189 /ORGANISM="Ammonia sp." /LENGTH=236 /DNA_ID=CAMNT_0042461165 /DNA_START=14 /DNA_END=724 /DNA_ORIENTATION=-